MTRQDARTAVEKARDKFEEAKLSKRRFVLTGAWAGSDWICNCKGRIHHGDERMCLQCDLRRPGMRHWMAQSLRWGQTAVADHHQAARDYLSHARFCGVFHSPTTAENIDALERQIAIDFHVDVEVLRDK